MRLTYPTPITFRKPKAVNAAKPDTHEKEINQRNKPSRISKSRRNSTEPGHTFPTLPSNEDSTYTLELKD